jgi:hypothetical protein
MASKIKNKQAYKSGPEIAAVHPDVWDKLEFTWQYGWLNVGDLLKAPGDKPGIFTLEPFEEPDIVGDPIKRLRVTFKHDEMAPNWANVVFDTCGTDPPKLAQDLPEWVDDLPTRKAYRNGLRAVIEELRADLCKLERIEGRFERIEKFPIDLARTAYDFRGIYLPGSVKSSAGPNTDLVVFVAKNPKGGPAPDGGATGPPKRP